MIEEDKPSFWEKVAAFVLACVAFAVFMTLMRMGVVGVMGICR